MKFYGDKNNGGTLATQARVEDVVTRTEQPFFMAGFVRPEEYATWGMLAALNSENRNNGTFALSMTGFLGVDLFEWRDGPFYTLAQAPKIAHNGTSLVLYRWQFIAAAIKDRCHSQIFLEGAWNEPTTQCVPWPAALVATTFGSYYDIRKNPGDAHVLNGGLRDWVIVTGIPTTEELMRMRSGEDPRAIWGASRVWGYWHFTTDPAGGAKEPDLTGHGHDLTYIGAGREDPRKPSLTIRGSGGP